MNDPKFSLPPFVRIPIFAAMAALVFSHVGHADSAKPNFSSVRTRIQNLMADESLPAISIAVARRGEIIWEEGFGWADKDRRIRATEHTPYALASVSKTITATATMVLKDHKRLELDRPVNAYLSSGKVSSPVWDPAGATVRRIATHTAGLTDFDRACAADQPDCHISAEETIQRYGVLVWPPGDHFDYSNLGYGILGEVIANVSGRDFAEFLRSEVFLPLGMARTSLGIDPNLETVTAAHYHSGIYGITGRAKQGGKSGSPGASAMYGSAHDLALFGMFHLKSHLPTQKAILSDHSIDEMQNSTVDNGGGRYGLSWWVDEDFYGYRSVLAQGGTDATIALVRLIPSESIVVVVLVNMGTAQAGKIVDETLGVLLPDYGEKKERAKQSKATHNKTSKAATPPQSPAQLAGTWAGGIQTYRGEVPLTLSISESSETHAKLGTQADTSLKDVRLEQAKFSGQMPGDLDTKEDTGPEPYDLRLRLRLYGKELIGAAITTGRPGSHYTPMLSYFVQLKKTENQEP